MEVIVQRDYDEMSRVAAHIVADCQHQSDAVPAWRRLDAARPVSGAVRLHKKGAARFSRA